MSGKVCVVTGATSGIGEVTASRLAADGARVVVLGRSREKCESVVQGITARGGRAEFVLADFASLADVRRAASELLARCERLDVLVNNAGAINMTRTTTKDGLETTFAVNHLAPFLLTALLLGRLKESAPSRIVNVASRAHTRSGIDLDDLEGKTIYRGFKAYAQSKLCNVLYTYELARRLEGTNVTANCLHPGVIRSGFGKNQAGIFNFGIKLVAPLLWSPEKGAQTSLFLAESKRMEGVTGKYFDDDTTELRSSKVSYDREVQRRLWEISERMTGVG
ncbi:MAG TPA: SDR family oxidoreductase [Polyangiaceae bacterium]|jgi:NAD(P)-dependent dehydrogenase (short-subunit alcohol dehydrogenase family)|nr:SDR family oxidoreductase [Polyangiaceae bacterium]